MSRIASNAALVLAIAAGWLCAGGCPPADRNAKPKPNVVRPFKEPTPPPGVPARRGVPLDPALAAAARQQIAAATADVDPIVRAHAIEAIKDSVGNEMSDKVLAGLSDREPVVRFAAALAAGEMRLQPAMPQLQQLAGDKDESIRVAVRFALHRLGNTTLSHELEQASRSPVDRTRADTAMVLGLLGEKSASNILEPMLLDRNPAVRLQAAEALWRLGFDTGLDTLIGATISRFASDQMIALLGLASTKDQRVIQHLRGALTSDYDEVALVAARALGMVGSDDGYGVALKGAASADPRQRLLAALAFGAIGRSDAQETLATLLKDQNTDVRLAAATAILQLKNG